MPRQKEMASIPRKSAQTDRSVFLPNLRAKSYQVPQFRQKVIERVEGNGATQFQRLAGDGVFVPEILDHLHQPSLSGVEVAVEFRVGEVIELFQDKRPSLVLRSEEHTS